MKQFKVHRFYLDLGPELGKFEPKVSDKKMKELLFLLFPNYENFTREAKQKAWKELRRLVYNKLKKGYEKKYSKHLPPTVHNLNIWKSKEYQNV
jgi:exonuclease I